MKSDKFGEFIDLTKRCELLAANRPSFFLQLMLLSLHGSAKPKFISFIFNFQAKIKWNNRSATLSPLENCSKANHFNQIHAQMITNGRKNGSATLSLLRDCSNLNHLNQIHAQIITTGLTDDHFAASKLINSFLAAFPSDLTHVCRVFHQIKNPNIFSWNSMFRAHANSSNPEQAIFLYNQMQQRGISPDHYTFPFVLKACSRLLLHQKGEEIHCLTVKLGLQFDVFVQNSLIYMYAICGRVEIARLVFDSIPIFIKDVVSWNSMISGYLQSGLCREALKIFEQMVVGSVRPNEVTVVSVLTTCARLGDLDFGRKIHCFVQENDLNFDVYLGSSLIDMYAKCGSVESARQLFDEMTERNVVCWTSMIAGYAQSGQFKEAIELFREMQITDIKPDEATVVCVISACAHLGALDLGRWVHTYCDRNNIELNVTVKNSLIDMYSKCGDIERAMQIFDGLVEHDVFSWTAMIYGLAMNGNVEGALDLFSNMRSSQVKPNDITFLGVLSACSHGGLVEEGQYYFNCITETYKLTPRIEHYGCMVDLLGRANLLVQAVNFIRAMPIEPDAVIWRSLLFACRSNGNIELAEFAAKQIMELEPKKCGVHVLLSNIYAEASRWRDVDRVRKFMKNSGIRKPPACSFVEINSVVHSFLVADVSHPQIDLIQEMIFGIDKVLRSEGYVPDTSE